MYISNDYLSETLQNIKVLYYMYMGIQFKGECSPA